VLAPHLAAAMAASFEVGCSVLLLFGLLLCMGTAVTIGLFPAWRHSGAGLLAGLHDHSRSATATSSSVRVRKILVAAQLAAVVVLVTVAGLFIRSFTMLLRLDLGFDPRGVLTFNVSDSGEKHDTKEKQWALIDAVLDSARRLPGSTAAGAVYERPFAHGAIGMDTSVIIEGQPLSAESVSRNPILNWEAATPDYFRAMDIRLLQGRLFNERDTAQSPPVVIIGQSLAARLWPGQDPVGRRMMAYGAPEKGDTREWQTVVGVVEDARYREVETPRFDLYLPYRQAPNQVQYFLVRFTGDPRAAVPALRTAVAALDPAARVDGISTIFAKAVNKLTGTKFKVVTGYPGSTEILLAMERGEVEGSSSSWAAVSLAKKEWLRDKKIRIILQTAPERIRELPDAPALPEIGTTPEDKQVYQLYASGSAIGRSVIAPPELPADRTKALREAFNLMVKDPEFLADIAKLNVELDPLTGEAVQDLIVRTLNVPPAVRERAKLAFGR